MQGIKKRYDGSKLFSLQIKPADHYNNDQQAPISAFTREIRAIDNTNHVTIDPARLALLFAVIEVRDFRFYFHIIGKMERNDKPVYMSGEELKKVFKVSTHAQVSASMKRIINSGLLFKVDKVKTQYLVNPMYAWKGNRLDYLDTSTFERKYD